MRKFPKEKDKMLLAGSGVEGGAGEENCLLQSRMGLIMHLSHCSKVLVGFPVGILIVPTSSAKRFLMTK